MTIDGLLIETKNLSVRLGGRTIIDDLSANWDSGKPTIIIGPNGAGKTTLINVLSGHVAAAAGFVYVGGCDITRLPAHIRARNYLRRSFQVPRLPPQLTGHELLGLARAEWRSKQSPDVDIVERLTEGPNIRALLDKPLGDLNHSARKLIELASVLVSPAPILLLDEPAAGLAADEKDLLHNALTRETNRTLIIVEHDLVFIERLGFQTQFMMDGVMVHSGSFHSTKQFAQDMGVYF